MRIPGLFGLRPSRSILKLVVAALLIASGVAAGLTARTVLRKRAYEAQLMDEARVYSEATGRSIEASLAVSRLCAHASDLEALSVTELDRLLRAYEGFSGEDRLAVARYCVGLLLSPETERLGPERLRVSREAITSIITEYAQEPQIIGAAFAIANVLGMADDPYLVQVASEVMVNPSIPEEVRAVIARTFLRTRNLTEGADVPAG